MTGREMETYLLLSPTTDRQPFCLGCEIYTRIDDRNSLIYLTSGKSSTVTPYNLATSALNSSSIFMNVGVAVCYVDSVAVGVSTAANDDWDSPS